ncbi:MAG: hypothetical protein M1818_003708 [Claussenomyces sp. TS43310]|nr:MAG: hypothetical protein M1818_003708 [Claussenomyces sp. TS43310]
MLEDEVELQRLAFVADVLQPIKLVVWGELAVRHLGVPVAHSASSVSIGRSVLLRILPRAMEMTSPNACTQALNLPTTNLDAATVRFHYPDEKKHVQRTVLPPASYIRLSIPQTPFDASEHFATPHGSSQLPFYIHGNLYYPNVFLLLQSIIMVYLEEQKHTDVGDWRIKLATWAIAYLYGELSLRDDILDACQDEGVKDFFNKKINRGSGTHEAREKWGKPKALITNDLIEDFQ